MLLKKSVHLLPLIKPGPAANLGAVKGDIKKFYDDIKITVDGAGPASASFKDKRGARAEGDLQGHGRLEVWSGLQLQTLAVDGSF